MYCTSRVSKDDETQLLTHVFQTLHDKQNICILLHDEDYVKKMLIYHGGEVFGGAANNSSLMAETRL